ncbi:hypothetical protein [Chryseobacterium sp. FH1]|uniref:hypothetical protein n=1 Tax=Chryseobacterium sp. FH1 TaxID=1233951 RepID=UPI0004E47013|nr:hypothetical protein [Chryseobacterium sp. FH1]KFC22875.1 hypothetical protein IO90_04750 [Chryseobacterium sp. FH1]
MVNKKVIEKLSDRELENYIKSDSKFVAPAITYAYEVLQSRGRVFEESEKLQIEQMISEKTQAETDEKHKYYKAWDENMTENPSAIELYSNKVIWIFSILFGVFFGGFLQAINFVRLKNNKVAVISASFGILFSAGQVLLLNYIETLDYHFGKSRFLPLFLSAIGSAILIFIRDKSQPKELKYKGRSFVVPLIVALVIYIPIVYFMFLELQEQINQIKQ